jgi:hypothetical protein
MPLFCNKTLRDSNKNFGTFIWWMENLTNMFLVFTPSVGVKYFWEDLDGRYVLRTPSVGAAGICGVYVILIFRALQTSHKGQQSLTKLNAKASNIYVEIFLA